MKKIAFVFPALLLLAACYGGVSGGRLPDAAPQQAVASVDLNRYAGLWYEIARYPNSFQRNCQGVTAEYALRPDGRVDVRNTCQVTDTPGKPRTAKGIASVIEGSGNARLAVNFAPIPLPRGQGNYWVLHLEPDYSLALIGSPSGNYLWMLSRTSSITPSQRGVLNAAAVRNGYRLDLLEETTQSPADTGTR
jgi:apolipoprotein D and lipocalin family protein